MFLCLSFTMKWAVQTARLHDLSVTQLLEMQLLESRAVHAAWRLFWALKHVQSEYLQNQRKITYADTYFKKDISNRA